LNSDIINPDYNIVVVLTIVWLLYDEPITKTYNQRGDSFERLHSRRINDEHSKTEHCDWRYECTTPKI